MPALRLNSRSAVGDPGLNFNVVGNLDVNLNIVGDLNVSLHLSVCIYMGMSVAAL